MSRFVKSVRKGTATFIFAAAGTMGLNEPLGMEVAQWKLAVAVGAGALVNAAYRWAEAVKKEA